MSGFGVHYTKSFSKAICVSNYFLLEIIEILKVTEHVLDITFDKYIRYFISTKSCLVSHLSTLHCTWKYGVINLFGDQSKL